MKNKRQRYWDEFWSGMAAFLVADVVIHFVHPQWQVDFSSGWFPICALSWSFGWMGMAMVKDALGVK